MFTRQRSQPPHPSSQRSAPSAGSLSKSPAEAAKSSPPALLVEAVPTRASINEEGLVTIGKGTHVTGKIGDCRTLDVHGVLEADVVAETVIVRSGGGIRGTIQTDNAVVHGTVEGELMVHEHLDVRETGEVSGSLYYGTISIAKGAKVVGAVTFHRPPSDDAGGGIAVQSGDAATLAQA